MTESSATAAGVQQLKETWETDGRSQNFDRITGAQKICILGLGYIGLPTACLMASKGMQVYGVDTDPSVIESINLRRAHIREANLDDLLRKALQRGNFTASLQPSQADVFIIAVPTPFKTGHVPDLSYVKEAALSIAPHVRPGNLVILESTSPVGTTERVADWLREKRRDLTVPCFSHDSALSRLPEENRIFIAYCPERVLPGRILEELAQNDRIVGGIDHASTTKAKNLYSTFVKGEVLTTDCRTAELCKLAENTFRDVNIAYANELSLICEKLGVDVWELRSLTNRHPRVNILKPGPGVGGHCIAVDPWFVVDSAPKQASLIRAARGRNDSMPGHVVARIARKATGLKNPVIACLGLSYKAGSDDLRESPAVEVTSRLAREKIGDILAVEPFITELPDPLSRLEVRLVDMESALREANIIVLLTDHEEFLNIEQSILESKQIIDTRGAWRA